MAKNITQVFEEASIDAQALEKFVNATAEEMVVRRLAEPIRPLSHYKQYMDSLSQGKDATITSVTAKSGAAGTEASVKVGGTPNARTFEFTIPKGENASNIYQIRRSYQTYELMVADKANIPANTSIDVTNDEDFSENGTYTYDGTSFTKSIHDTQEVLKKAVEDIKQDASDAIGQAVQDYGYVIIDSFEQGATLTQRNQALRYASTGKLYRWAGDLPKVVPASSTPNNSGGIGVSAWLEVSDATLRQDIVSGGLVTGEMLKVISTHAGGVIRTQASKNNDIVNVKDFGAKGDGIADDTVNIQKAIDAVAIKGGEVHVPDGVYMIKADVPSLAAEGNILYDNGGIALKDNVTLNMSSGATLKAIPNAEKKYVIVRIYNKNNVKVRGGNIVGERDLHTGVGGEWGYGIAITGGSNIAVTDTELSDCWGDGINVQYYVKGGTSDVKDTTNLYISGVKSRNNRRQGMSIESCVNGLIVDSEFSDTNGTQPMAGVDIEPAYSLARVKNIIFNGCTFKNNAKSGLVIYGAGISRVLVNSCQFLGNKDSYADLKTQNNCNDITVSNSFFDGQDTPVVRGILLQDGTNLKAFNNVLINRVLGVNCDNFNVDNVQFIGNSVSVTKEVAKLLEVRDKADLKATKVRFIDNSWTYSVVGAASSFLIANSDTTLEGNELVGDFNISLSGVDRLAFNRNTVHDKRLYGLSLQGNNVVVNGNTFYAPTYANSGQPVFYTPNTLNYSEVSDNTIYCESIHNPSVASLANKLWSGGADSKWLKITDNKTYKKGSTGFAPLLASLPVFTSPNKVKMSEGLTPVGGTGARPLDAKVGDSFFDTTLGFIVICKSKAVYYSDGLVTPAVWVDSAGTTV